MSINRISTSDFVLRHRATIPLAQHRILGQLATADRSGVGRVRDMPARVIAERLGKALSTVKAQMCAMTKDGRWLQRTGWTYIIVGAAEHDIDFCYHPECIADATEAAALRRADQLAERRRAQTAERVRRYRKNRQQTG